MPEIVQQLRELIAKYKLEGFESALLSSAKASIELRLEDPPSNPPAGASRFGGMPDLRAQEDWPRNGATPLSFLCQVKLADLPRVTGSEMLPAAGLLSFFYDIDRMPWGHETSGRNGWRVLYHEDESTLSRQLVPTARYEPKVLPEYAVSFRPTLTLPATRSIAMDPLDLNENEFDRYCDLRDILSLAAGADANDPLHRVLGHPDGIQGCMQRTVQFVSRDEHLPAGVYSYYEHPRAEELIPGAMEWELLLQFDSDRRLGVMWGDAGKLFFWVHRSDLQHRNFGNAWLFLQCH